MLFRSGEPGIGKSTLSLQIALAANGLKTLYVSGEESQGLQNLYSPVQIWVAPPNESRGLKPAAFFITSTEALI